MLEVSELCELLLDWKVEEITSVWENRKDGCRSSVFHCATGLLQEIHTNHLRYLVALSVRGNVYILWRNELDGTEDDIVKII